MSKKHVIVLSDTEYKDLEHIISRGLGNVRQVRRAHTLLLSNAGNESQREKRGV
jgi:hypothetical protein